MNRVVTRPLHEDKDGVQGYIAYPEREEKGPGLLLIHQHSGLTGYLKTAAYRFAQLGYTTVVPNLYHMLGYPAETHIDKGTEIQNKTPDPDFLRVIDRGWKYIGRRSDVNLRAWGSSATAWEDAWVSILSRQRRLCAHSSRIIHPLRMSRRRASGRAIRAMRRGRLNVRP